MDDERDVWFRKRTTLGLDDSK